jgi:diaminohydroxyphosphoribosylaminopyrimidine deaminase/5-amino-6-(5-phosphoribosylamino)uracil reductase
LRELGSRSIQSVLVEGGSTVAGEFIDAGLVNKITFLIAPKIIGGVTAPGAVGGSGFATMSEALELERLTLTKRGNDIEVTAYPRTAKGIRSDEG